MASSLPPFLRIAIYLFMTPCMHTFTHISIYQSNNSPAHPSIHPALLISLHLSIYLSIHPSFPPYFHLFIHPSVHPTILPCFPPSNQLSIHPSLFTSIYSSIHPPIHSPSPVRHFSAIAANHTQKFNGSSPGVAKHFYCDREAIKTFYFFPFFSLFISLFFSSFFHSPYSSLLSKHGSSGFAVPWSIYVGGGVWTEVGLCLLS